VASILLAAIYHLVMGTKLCVDRSCAPKLSLGEGDKERGTQAIFELFDTQGRAEALLAQCREKGLSPDTTKLEITLTGKDGETKEELTVTALRERARPLDAQERHCEGCPARVEEEPFGCFGHVRYPIPRAVEEWLVNLVRPATELGGIVWLQASRDFNWTGYPTRTLRSMDFFESKEAVVRDLGDGATVSSDSIFQAILTLETLSPTHCAIVLACFGVVLLDGQPLVGTDKSGLRPLLTVPVAERAARTALVLPPPPPEGMQAEDYLRFLYRAWVTGDGLFVLP
jgi:hypothetical protein